jgi:hypothetical protein
MYESPLTGFAGAGFGLAVRVAPDGGGGGGGAGESLTVDPDGGVGAGTGVAVGAGVAVAVGVAQLITLHSALATCDGVSVATASGMPPQKGWHALPKGAGVAVGVTQLMTPHTTSAGVNVGGEQNTHLLLTGAGVGVAAPPPGVLDAGQFTRVTVRVTRPDGELGSTR